MILLSYHTEILPKVRFIGRIHYKTPWKHFSRVINEYVLYIIKDGEMFIKEEDKKYHLKSGDFFLLEPNLLHVGYSKATCDYYYIHFKHEKMAKCDNQDNDKLDELMEKRRKCLLSYNLSDECIIDPITYLPKLHNLSSSSVFQDLKNILEVYNKREEYYKTVTSTRIHSFLLNVSHEMLLSYMKSLSKSSTKKSELIVEQILDYINHNYMSDINSKMIEDMFEVNFDYINRVFSRITGSTIFKFINSIRINNAKQLIETSNLPFGEIAYLVGIEDRYYFSKLFHRYTGLTPTQYYNNYHKIKE